MFHDLQIYKQRVKHLLFDHENELTEYKTGECMHIGSTHFMALSIWKKVWRLTRSVAVAAYRGVFRGGAGAEAGAG